MAKPKFLSLDGVRTLVTYIKEKLATKVDKEPGKSLSDNNYSDADVDKLESIESGAQENLIESICVNGDTQIIDQKSVNITIPTKTSDLTNDSNYATTDELTDELATKEDTLQYGIATSADVGKAMMPKTVADGKVTSWEFGEAGKVDNVQVNGTSILENKVANIPIATANAPGVIKVSTDYGLQMTNNGFIRTRSASQIMIKAGENNVNQIAPMFQHESTFYGLAKVAGHDEKDSELPVGTYTDEAKSAIQSMLGIDEFDFSDRIAKGVDDNGNIVNGAIIEGNVSGSSKNKASGYSSHAEGGRTTASGGQSHAEGGGTIASGGQSHAEGSSTKASGTASHAEGTGTTASDYSSHAEGESTTASGPHSHAEGGSTTASNTNSHAEGNNTIASGPHSHAEGGSTKAIGMFSHAEGYSTTANHESQHVFGEFNIEDPSSEPVTNKGTYVEIVGNGTGQTRSNARTLDWSGNEVLAGKLTVGTNPINTMDVTTKGYVDTAITNAVGDITGFEFQVVTELPVTGTKGIIYLRAHSHGDNDAYDEYIWVTDRYERLGTLDVDLSNYVTFDDYASGDKAGVVKVKAGDHGLILLNNGYISTYPATSDDIKNGTNNYRQPAVNKQHESTFYGLAKSAGDTTQSQSSNAVGTYTDEAKSAIKTMLGFATSSDISSAIDNLVNTRYHVCEPGEYNSTTYIPTLAGELGVIYLVPKPIGDTGIDNDSITGTAQVGTATVATTNNIFYEYIYTGTKFEQIGDTKVDLTGYITDADIATDASVTTMLNQVFS